MAKAKYLNGKLPKVGSTIIVVALNKGDAFLRNRYTIIGRKFKVVANEELRTIGKTSLINKGFNPLVWGDFRCKVIK